MLGTSKIGGRPMTVRPTFVWSVFVVLVVLATAPVWRLAAFGFNPTLDDFLAFICSSSPSGRPPMERPNAGNVSAIAIYRDAADILRFDGFRHN